MNGWKNSESQFHHQIKLKDSTLDEWFNNIDIDDWTAWMWHMEAANPTHNLRSGKFNVWRHHYDRDKYRWQFKSIDLYYDFSLKYYPKTTAEYCPIGIGRKLFLRCQKAQVDFEKNNRYWS